MFEMWMLLQVGMFAAFTAVASYALYRQKQRFVAKIKTQRLFVSKPVVEKAQTAVKNQ
jgi:hypothetical protein